MIDRIQECLAHPERTYSPGEFRAMLKWLHKEMDASTFKDVNKYIVSLEALVSSDTALINNLRRDLAEARAGMVPLLRACKALLHGTNINGEYDDTISKVSAAIDAAMKESK